MEQADSVTSIIAPGAVNVPAAAASRPPAKSTGISPAKLASADAAIDAVMVMIARAADAGQVDVVRNLLEWRDQQIALAAKLAFQTAMAAAQEEMAPIRADMVNPDTDSRYGSLEAVDKEIRKVYTAHGFSPTFDTEDTPDPLTIRVICDLNHRDGHTRRYGLPMPCDGKGPKGNPVMSRIHAVGSALTYGQRYLLRIMFNLVVSKKQDDDGNAASRRPQVQRQHAAPAQARQTPTFQDRPRQAATVAEPPRRRLESDYHPHPEGFRKRRGPMTVAVADLQKQARAAARQGFKAINDFCLTLTRDQGMAAVDPIRPELDELVRQAETARAVRAARPPVPRHNEHQMADAAAADIAANGWPKQAVQSDDLDIPDYLRRTRR